MVFVLTVPMLAHDLYLMPQEFHVRSGKKIPVAFHNGDDFPESQAAARIERLLEPSVLSVQGNSIIQDLYVDGTLVRGEAEIAHQGNIILAVRTKPNGIEMTPLDFEKYLKHEGLDHVIRWRAEHGEAAQSGKERYSKYVKSILQSEESSDFYRHSVGYPIEIMPEANPYSLKPGETLPIQVLFRGKPVADLQIEMSWLTPEGKATTKVAGRTGADGRLKIPLSSAGIWKLHTVLMERCQEPATADWESFWSSLTFQIR